MAEEPHERTVAKALLTFLDRLTSGGTAAGPSLSLRAFTGEELPISAAIWLRQVAVLALAVSEGAGAEPTDTRDPCCVERWPECESGKYDPRCCRFPKSCSVDSHGLLPEPGVETTPSRADFDKAATPMHIVADDFAPYERREKALTLAIAWASEVGHTDDDLVVGAARHFEGYLRGPAAQAWLKKHFDVATPGDDGLTDVERAVKQEREAVLAMIEHWRSLPTPDTDYDQGWQQALSNVVRDVGAGEHLNSALRGDE